MLGRSLLIVLVACGTAPPHAPPHATVSTHVDPIASPEPAEPIVGDRDTGFDLYVTPGNVPGWSLDGEHRTDRLPSRIRGLAPGVHELVIDAAPGYRADTETLTIVLGKAPRVEIMLAPVLGESDTGFDLYVTPDVPGWSLDGEHRTDRLPSRIRGLAPGVHELVIDAAPGYLPATEKLTIVLGKAPRIEVRLEPTGK